MTNNTLYGTWRCIALFTKDYCTTLLSASWIQLTTYPPTPPSLQIHYNVILPHGAFRSGFPNKMTSAFPTQYSHITHPDLITSKYLVCTNHDAPHSTTVKIFQFHSLSPSHRSIHSPHHFVFKHPQSTRLYTYCWLGQPWNDGSISGRVKRCFIFQSAHTGCEAQRAPHSKDKECSSRGLLCPGRELTSPSSAKFKNAWSFVLSLLLYAIMVYTQAMLPFMCNFSVILWFPHSLMNFSVYLFTRLSRTYTNSMK